MLSNRRHYYQPIHFAVVQGGAGSCLEEVLKFGADPEARVNNIRQSTPLTLVTRLNELNVQEYAAVVSLLLQHRASIDTAESTEETALDIAVACGNERYVEVLLDFGASPTPGAVWRGIQSYYPGLVLMLLDAGAEIDEQTVDLIGEIRDSHDIDVEACHKTRKFQSS